MDLLNFLVKTRDVRTLLAQYQESLWPRVIRAVLLYGFYSLRGQSWSALSIEALEDKVRRSGYYIQVEDMLPSLRKQIDDVKTEISKINTTLETEADPIPRATVPRKVESPKQAQIPEKPKEKGEEAYRKGFPSSKQPPRSTLIFRDTSPPTLRPGVSNYSMIMRPNDMWGHQWTGEDYTKEIYPDWWLDMGKMETNGSPTGKITGSAAPIINAADYVSFKPEPKKRTKVETDTSGQGETPTELAPESEEIEVEDRAVQMPSLQNSQPPSLPSPVHQARPPRHSGRGNYSGWIGNYSNLVKRSPSEVQAQLSSSDSRYRDSSPHPEDPLHYESSQQHSYNPRIDAQIAEKEFEISGSLKSSGGQGVTRKLEASSGSSMSTYRPTEEMKRFYRTEYDRLAQSGGTSMRSSERVYEDRTWSDGRQAERSGE